MSRAVIYETFGGPEVLELREVPEPHAGPGEVRVRVASENTVALLSAPPGQPSDISSLSADCQTYGITLDWNG